MDLHFKRLLYAICVLTDFAAFIVVFGVSRGLAEAKAPSSYLGIAGAGLALSSGLGSILGGWLAHRFNGRAVFVSGAAMIGVSAFSCSLGSMTDPWRLPNYWLLGIGLGCLYPPLIGWLNYGADAHADRRGVSRTLILFCVAWNLGMMAGQLTAGELFSRGPDWLYDTALAASCANLVLAIVAARRVVVLPPATSEHPSSDGPTAPLASAFKRLSWIANLGGMFGGSMVIHLLPGLMVTIGIAADRHGQLLAGWRGVIIATYLVLHIMDFWHYRLGVSLASQLLAAIGLVVMGAADSAPTLAVGLALLGQLVGFNYFSGLVYSTAGSHETRRALAAGIHEATLAFGMAIGTIAGGVFATMASERVPYRLAAGVLLAMICIQALAWYRWVRPLQRRSEG